MTAAAGALLALIAGLRCGNALDTRTLPAFAESRPDRYTLTVNVRI